MSLLFWLRRVRTLIFMSATPSRTGSASSPATGFAAAVGAFLIWGLFPLYLKPLSAVSAQQIIAHRMVWCCVFVFLYLGWRGSLREVAAAVRSPAVTWRLCLSATLITINWLTYVWSVGHHHVVDTSLGYFINPLVNVLLGVALLSERLNRLQWTAIGLAAVGVIYMAVNAGHPPWISLTLAFSFGLYGLIRKTVAVDAAVGLAAETLILAPLGLLYLIACERVGIGSFGHVNAVVTTLLVCSGIVTAVSLALFAFGARLLPYSTIGLIQYLAPSLQLLLGVFLYHESFSQSRAIGFACIWTALVIVATDSLLQARRPTADPVPTIDAEDI